MPNILATLRSTLRTKPRNWILSTLIIRLTDQSSFFTGLIFTLQYLHHRPTVTSKFLAPNRLAEDAHQLTMEEGHPRT